MSLLTHARSRGLRRALAAPVAALVAAAVLPVTSSPAAAVPSAGVTSTSTTQASSHTGTATTLAGMTVTDPDASQRLQVEVSTTLGTLSIPTRTGLTLGYNNAWTGEKSVSFSGVASNVNAALASARLVGGGTSGSATVSVTSMHEDSGYVYSAPNQHFYQYVADPGITWTDARTAAAALSYKGQQGYLATMPTQELNDFVTNRIQDADNVWFGATVLTTTPPSGVARQWAWSGGPLAGRVFTECSNTSGNCAFVNTGSRFESWAPGEPNNAGGENAPVTNWQGGRGEWNDLSPTNTGYIAGYVVEYGNQEIGTSTPFADFHKASSTVALADVPSTPAQPAVAVGNGTLTASLTAPADNGSALTKYVVTATPVGGGTAVNAECTAPATTCAVTGLTNGQAYDVTVVAWNGRGASAASPARRATPRTVPGAPADVAATALNGGASVTFTAPTSNGGSPITGYTVTATPDGGGTPVVQSCGASPCAVTGLTNGTPYTFTAKATNVAGSSAPSAATAAVTPTGPPAAPTGATVTRGNGKLTLDFTPAASPAGAPVTSYTVTATPAGGGTPLTITCNGTPCEVGPLTNGVSYAVAVRSVGPGGTSSSVPAGSATPATAPDAPGTPSVTRGNGTATLDFARPASDGGSPITDYQYSVDGGATWTVLPTTGTTTRTGTVTGLTNGTDYTFVVRARNAVAPSPGAAAGSAVRPATVPDAPTVGTVVPGDGSAVVSFGTPTDNGGEEVTSYVVTAQPGGISQTCTQSPCLVTGLTNGTPYTFKVVAKNAVGDSAASAPSDPATPFTVPGAPTIVSLTSQDGGALVELDPPTSTGGRPVTGYQYSVDGGATWAFLPTTAGNGGRLQGLVTGLDNGEQVTVLTRAVNAAGEGAASTGAQVTPAGPPSAPRDIEVEVHGLTATVSWEAPADDGGSPVTSYVVTAQPGGMTCTVQAPARTCEVPGLEVGRSYRFVVTAVNTAGAMPGTGIGSGGDSDQAPVTAVPGAPAAPTGVPGDRVLTVRWQAPTNPGTSPVRGYQLSLDGGRTWKNAVTRGTTTLSTVVEGVRNGRSYPARVRAVNASGPGTAAAVRIDEPQWFADPLSPAQRADLLPVPSKPTTVRGAVRRTAAFATASNGVAAMQLDELRGRQLQSGQAATLTDRSMFVFNKPVLTQYGRDVLRSMVTSLKYVEAVRCEGHVDFGGRARRAEVLARQRAAMACEVLKNYGADVTTTTKGFGNRVPVVVGGRGHQDRWPNRRVVVVVTKG